MRLRSPWLVGWLVAFTLGPQPVSADELPSMFREPGLVFVLAADGSELTAQEAWERLRSEEGFKMTRLMGEGESAGRVLIYREASELAGQLPTQAVSAMEARSEGSEAEDADRALGETYPSATYGDLEGGELSIDALRGRVVVLNFWFVACAPCIVEIPTLNRLVERFADDEVSFVAVTFDDADTVRGLTWKHPFDYRIALTSHQSIRNLGIFSYPTHLVLDREGVVRYVQRGLHGLEELERELAQAIEKALR